MPYKFTIRDLDSKAYCAHCGKIVSMDQFCMRCKQCQEHCDCDRPSLVQCRGCEKQQLASEICPCCGRCKACQVHDSQFPAAAW
ncbi:MAG: hypothetical protein ACOYUZ_05945 [Patescibacteria group bacterium]